MDGKLLVRMYNVGLGDCIYVRIPDQGTERHVLIDCGNKFGSEDALTEAIENLRVQLPPDDDEPAKKRLDLLVVTHSHEDHVRGFDAEALADVKIHRIWLSAGMNPHHPQAEQSRRLQRFAMAALEDIRASNRRGLGSMAASLLSLSKSEGMDAILKDLPERSGVDPLYVHAETSDDELALFDDPDIRFKVLAPMMDIDRYYLGKVDHLLLHDTVPPEPPTPHNISAADFSRLRESLLHSALGFVMKAGHLVNNTSVVLLLEWRGRRLLFTGDAEAKTAFGGEYQEGRSNGSWNVMWKERRDELAKPLDFLKVGHHGSYNATPWTAKTYKDGEHPLNRILDAILPPSEAPTAQAVVSTERTNSYKKIPEPLLMAELGRRVANTRRYQEPRDEGKPFVPEDVDQPQRTDLESAPFLDVLLTPVDRE